MRRSAKLLVGAAAVIVLVAAGTVLPGEMAAGRDRMILGQVHSEPLDVAELSDYVNISMVDKVSLLGQTAGTTFVPLLTGAVYDQDTVRAKFLEELEKLHALRFYPQPLSGEIGGFRSEATLYIQNDAPAINMIVWKITLRMDSLSGVFYMDDQTGKILSFDFSGNAFDDWAYQGSLIREWGAYLGADVRNIKQNGQADQEGNDIGDIQYSFELFSGTRSVSGQIGSIIQAGAEQTNRWSLNYLQLNYDRIILRE